MMKKTVLFAVAIMIVFAMFNVVRAEENEKAAPAAVAAPTPDAKAAAKQAEVDAAAAKKLDELDAFGKNLCKQIVGKPADVLRNMNFEFIIRLTSTPERIKELGGDVKKLAQQTLEMSMAEADKAQLKGVKCEMLSKDVLPCDKLYALLAQSPNIQEAWPDNKKIKDSERMARISNAATESGVTSCGIMSLKSQVKGESEMTETISTGETGGKWTILEIISTVSEQK